jgi:hypothetical protein
MTTTSDADPNPNTTSRPVAGPPTKHQLALMIWLAVFPTLTVLNLALGDWLRTPDTGRAHVRPRDRRRPDRHLRIDATTAPAPPTRPNPRTDQLRDATTREESLRMAYRGRGIVAPGR